MQFKQGDIVEHKLTKDWLMVLQIRERDRNEPTLICRSKDLKEIALNSFEVEAKGQGRA